MMVRIHLPVIGRIGFSNPSEPEAGGLYLLNIFRHSDLGTTCELNANNVYELDEAFKMLFHRYIPKIRS
jgi:hypothetical protein